MDEAGCHQLFQLRGWHRTYRVHRLYAQHKRRLGPAEMHLPAEDVVSSPFLDQLHGEIPFALMCGRHWQCLAEFQCKNFSVGDPQREQQQQPKSMQKGFLQLVLVGSCAGGWW